MNIKAYLQLCRPANIITAIADILAGVAIASFATPLTEINPFGVILLCISTIGLYGGGIVFNDIFDLELDKIERPERAIPSGRISLRNAYIFGTVLLLIAIISAFSNGSLSGIIATLIAISALVYDKYGKHHSF
ncbi:UbiA family prenyltransferase, partial [Lacihabitans soyangensis]